MEDKEAASRNSKWLRLENVGGYCDKDLITNRQFSMPNTSLWIVQQKNKGLCDWKLSEAECKAYADAKSGYSWVEGSDLFQFGVTEKGGKGTCPIQNKLSKEECKLLGEAVPDTRGTKK